VPLHFAAAHEPDARRVFLALVGMALRQQTPISAAGVN